METIEIKDWGNFSTIAEKLSSMGPEGPNVFRGQEDAEWPLRPSLTRLLLEQNVDLTRGLEIEKKALREFQKRAHIDTGFCRDLRKDDTLSWWEIMQHYGAPTRLLDWTKSPYIALYYAVENIGNTKIDAALFQFNVGHLNFVTEIRNKDGGPEKYPLQQIGKSIVGEEYEPYLEVIGSPRPTDRMVAQQSSFSVCTELLEDHEKFADNIVFNGVHGGEGQSIFTKFIIKGNLKPRFLANLEMMNITANALFPGIDGLGRSISEMARISAWRVTKEAT
ncbi:MAG: FRG domain-containing protein [Chloroflexota bacterium]